MGLSTFDKVFFGAVGVGVTAGVVARHVVGDDDGAPKPVPTKEELLRSNAFATKVLLGSMVGLPATAGAGMLGSKGLDAVADRTTGVARTLARGGASTCAVVGGLAAIGGILAVSWGPVGLIASANERAAIERGENPYDGD